VGRADIEAIRGVQAGPLLRSLLQKGLIRITGRAEVIGRPLLYGTTRKFLEHFGLKSLNELPRVDELPRP
jgi:segregation and condensation protein B